MAEFTVTLQEVIDADVDLGLRDYPIFDPAYRTALNDAIVAHFRFREIGAETPALFVFYLNRKMNEIMPFYNDLFRSQQIEFNPLYNTDISTESTTNAEASATSEGTSDANATSRNAMSTTPQTRLAGNEDYATNINDAVSSSAGTTTGTESNTALTEYVNRVSGYTGQSPSMAIMDYRATLLNTNLLIFEQLEVCFMQLWDNGCSW